MKFLFQLSLVFFSLFTLACHNVEQKPVINPFAAPVTTPNVQAPAVEEEPMADIQTLTENHKILLIRVVGNQSKLSAETKSKITSSTTAFNAAFEQLKTDLNKADDLRVKLKALRATHPDAAAARQELEQLSSELTAANATAASSNERYEALAREFAQLIEEVRKERGF